MRNPNLSVQCDILRQFWRCTRSLTALLEEIFSLLTFNEPIRWCKWVSETTKHTFPIPVNPGKCTWSRFFMCDMKDAGTHRTPSSFSETHQPVGSTPFSRSHFTASSTLTSAFALVSASSSCSSSSCAGMWPFPCFAALGFLGTLPASSSSWSSPSVFFRLFALAGTLSLPLFLFGPADCPPGFLSAMRASS